MYSYPSHLTYKHTQQTRTTTHTKMVSASWTTEDVNDRNRKLYCNTNVKRICMISLVKG